LVISFFNLIDIFFSLFDIVNFLFFITFPSHLTYLCYFIFLNGMLCVAQFWLCHSKSNLWNQSPRNLGGNKLTGLFPSNLFNCSFMLQEVWVYIFTPNSMCSCSYVRGWTSIYLMVLSSFLAYLFFQYILKPNNLNNFVILMFITEYVF
jgi:hypothetical protein